MINPKKDGWYLAYDMEWDRMLYKNGKWIAQTKTRHVGNMTDVMIRDDMTKYVTAWLELPAKPELGDNMTDEDLKKFLFDLEQYPISGTYNNN